MVTRVPVVPTRGSNSSPASWPDGGESEREQGRTGEDLHGTHISPMFEGLQQT